MSSFGALLTIDELAGGDLLKWEAVLEQQYINVLRKRQMNLAVSEYKKRHHDFMKKQAERN